MKATKDDLVRKIEVGQRVKQFRADLTQAEFADRVGYGTTKTIISQVERGISDPGIPLLLYLEDQGISIRELLGLNPLDQVQQQRETESQMLALEQRMGEMQQSLQLINNQMSFLTRSFTEEDLRLSREIQLMKEEIALQTDSRKNIAG